MQPNHPIPQNRTVYRSALLTGTLLILFAVFHSVLGFNEIQGAIHIGDISKDSANMIAITWLFAGLGLFLIGAWILIISGELKSLRRKAWWQALFISLFLSAFGGVCWVYYPSETFLIGFFLTGLILLMPLLIYSRDYFSRR